MLAGGRVLWSFRRTRRSRTDQGPVAPEVSETKSLPREDKLHGPCDLLPRGVHRLDRGSAEHLVLVGDV